VCVCVYACVHAFAYTRSDVVASFISYLYTDQLLPSVDLLPLLDIAAEFCCASLMQRLECAFSCVCVCVCVCLCVSLCVSVCACW